MIWINFLHLYQPGNTEDWIIREAVEKSYKRIISGLERNPQIKFTLNITGCLVLRLKDLGYSDLLQRIDDLIKRGQIELTGSASYHPLLPLISQKEATHQIKENEEILKQAFPNLNKLAGFFIPEMAYSPKISKLVKKLGYEWAILAEISATEKIDLEQGYKDKASGLKFVFRSRALSRTYVPDILPTLDKKVVITATDGELYGLRHNDPTGKFENSLKSGRFQAKTISEFLKEQTSFKAISLRPSNWESTEEELEEGMPYALWYNKENPIHKELWKLAKLAQKTVEQFADDKNYYWAHWHFTRGLASCMFWWASGKDFRNVFGPICWNPDEIERGVNDLIRSIRSLDNKKSRPLKLKAEKLNAKIRKMIWENHWKNW